MPPYQYTPYVNPYVQSISALLQQPGQIEAQRAMTVGNAQAQAAQASGQAYGNAIQSAGQAIGQIPQQMRAAQMQQLQMQDVKGQIAERNAAAAKAQRDMAAQQAGEQAIRGAVGADGKIDYEKAASAWEQAGFPVQANAYRESVQKTRVTAQQLEEGQAKIEAGKRQVQQGYTDHLAELGAAGLEKLQSATPVEARDYAMGLVANAASHGLVSPDDAKKTLMQTASASPEQLSAIYQKLVDASPTVKERMVKDALTRAETEKNLAEAKKASNPPERAAKSLQSENEWQVDGKSRPVIFDPATGARYLTEADVALKRPIDPARLRKIPTASETVKPIDQNKLEQEYRTALLRGLSNRSGGLGLEDAKVQQANHLVGLMDQNYDAKSGEYKIPTMQLNELALGLARLISPNGQVGIELSHELNQRTVKGDFAGALTYLTGTPFTGNTQDIIKMFHDSILRQGEIAQQNREGEMGYLRGLVPTDLEESRRTALEAHTLNPLRQSRVANGPNGEKKLVVSIDGGKTWK